MSEVRSQAQGIPSFARSEYGDIEAYFREVARHYDSDKENPYWAFSHDVLEHIIDSFLQKHFSENEKIRLFDAGAGTGNWTEFILSRTDKVSATMFDMNPAMLRVAHGKISGKSGHDVRIVEGNLEEKSHYPAERPNLTLCFHCPIGFARDTGAVLKNLHDHLEPGGMALITAPNKMHAFNFAKATARSNRELARIVLDGTVKFKDDMPEIFCYTPEEFSTELQSAGFSDVTVLGYPVTVYPDARDTKHHETTSSIDMLRNPSMRAALLEMEKTLCMDPANAYRGGSNLFAACIKSPHEYESH